MKKFLIATAALASVAVVAPANAADILKAPPPVVMPALYNWSGIYIGVEGGVVLGQRSHWTQPEADADEVTPDLGHPLHGGFVGGEAGFNWQAPGSRWVFGIEGDGNWSEFEEALNCDATDFTGTGTSIPNSSCGSRIRSFFTVRGRIGYAFGPRGDFLVFVTGGGVWADQSVRIRTLTTPFESFEQFKSTAGWTAGGGAEYGITPWLSLKGEVLYVDLSGKDYNVAGCTFCGDDDIVHIKHNFVLARMGLNFRFGWGKTPAAPVVARY